MSPTSAVHSEYALELVKIAWDGAGARIVAVYADGTAEVWDVETETKQLILADPLREATEWVTGGDKVDIIAAEDDRLPRVYYTSMEHLLGIACQRAVRNMTREEWGQYMGDEPHRETCPLE
jgi:hypothetical protein